MGVQYVTRESILKRPRKRSQIANYDKTGNRELTPGARMFFIGLAKLTFWGSVTDRAVYDSGNTLLVTSTME